MTRRRAAALLFAVHAAAAAATGRPNAGDTGGVLLGLLHFAAGCAALWVVGRALARRAMPDADRAEGALATAVAAISAWVVVAHALGLGGALRFVPAAVAVDLLAAAALLLDAAGARRTPAGADAARWPVLVLVAILLRFAAPWGEDLGSWITRPPVNPDTVDCYHYAALRTVQNGGLDLPFRYDEEATPYFPTSWVVLWAAFFLPLAGTDWLALWLQAPGILLALLGLFVAARRAGASAWSAAAATAVLACERHLQFRQSLAFGGTDLWALGALAAALGLLLSALREGGAGRWALAGAAGGLALGIKADVVLFVPGLVALAAAFPAAAPRRWVALALGAAAAGGYGYARNLAATGNPLFPYPIRIGALTLLPGMEASTKNWRPDFFSVSPHLDILRNFSEFTQEATLALLGGWLLFALSMRRRPNRADAAIAGLPLLLYALCFLHPQWFSRRLYFFLLSAAVPFALLLDRIEAPTHLGAVLDRLAALAGLDRVGNLAARRRRLAAAGAAVLAVAALSGVPRVVRRYLAERPIRFEGFASVYGDRARLWAAVETATVDRAETVALVGVSSGYNFAGPRLENPVVHLPRHGVSGRTEWGWGDPVERPYAPVEEAGLAERLDAVRASLAVVARSAPEDTWLRAAGAAPIASTEGGTLYRLPSRWETTL